MAGRTRHGVLDRRPLEQSAGHPHHSWVGADRSFGRVRVGGLGVIDIVHRVDDTDRLATVPAHPESGQRVGNRPGRDVHRAGQPGSAEGVEHPDRAGHRDRGHRGQHEVLGEGPVNQCTVANTEFARGRLAKPESDLHRGRSPGQQGAGGRIVEAHHRHSAGQSAGLRRRIGVESSMPVQVILGDIEHHAGVRAQRRRPEQLEAGHLDGQQFDRPRQDVEHRFADVSAQRRRSAAGAQHLVQHRGGGGLPVGAGDHQPAFRWTVVPGRVKAPGQLDITPDRHRGGRRGSQHRCGRRKARAGHHKVPVRAAGGGDVGGDGVHAGEGTRCGEVVVADPQIKVPGSQGRHHRTAGDPGAGHQDARARPQRRSRLSPRWPRISHRWH